MHFETIITETIETRQFMMMMTRVVFPARTFDKETVDFKDGKQQVQQQLAIGCRRCLFTCDRLPHENTFWIGRRTDRNFWEKKFHDDSGGIFSVLPA